MLKGTVAEIRLALIGVKISIVSEHYAEAFQARARVRQARYPGCSISRSAPFHGCVSAWLSSQVRNLPYEMLCPGHLACFILVLAQWGHSPLLENALCQTDSHSQEFNCRILIDSVN